MRKIHTVTTGDFPNSTSASIMAVPTRILHPDLVDIDPLVPQLRLCLVDLPHQALVSVRAVIESQQAESE